MAVERVEDPRELVAPTAPSCATRPPKPKNAGTIASRSRSWARQKSSIAVSTPFRGPPSRAAERGYGRPPGHGTLVARVDPPRRHRRPAGGPPPGSPRRRSSRRGGRAASSTSWNSSSGSRALARALADQPQLLGDRVVVVVAVDHDRVGQRQLRRAPRGSCWRTARARGCSLASCSSPGCGAGSIASTRASAVAAHADQHPGQVTGERADLGHRLRARGVEAAEHQLGHLRHRDAPARGVAQVGVELERRAGHRRRV